MADLDNEIVPGQCRKSSGGVVWGVVKPHPKRKGFWICVSNFYSYEVATIGRHELKVMPLVQDNYWSNIGHPGLRYWQSFIQMDREMRRQQLARRYFARVRGRRFARMREDADS